MSSCEKKEGYGWTDAVVSPKPIVATSNIVRNRRPTPEEVRAAQRGDWSMWLRYRPGHEIEVTQLHVSPYGPGLGTIWLGGRRYDHAAPAVGETWSPIKPDGPPLGSQHS